MIIGIDGNEANLEIRVGVGQYAFNLLTSLSKIDQSNQYYVFLKNAPLSDMPPESPNWHYLVFGPKKLWTKFALPLYLYTRSPKLDLFFSPSHYSPSFSPFPTVPTIHDIGYLQFKDQFTKKDLYQLINWTKESLAHAKHIIAVSQFTKNELIKTYQINSDKISIVYNGVGSPPILNKPKDVLSKFKITQPYFLFVSTLKPNKNIPFLIESFAKFSKDNSEYQLVIAGKKGWLFESIFDTVKSVNLENKIIFTDYITENEKWCLYSQATATVLPSVYEGFGIPTIESQKVGTPVIASDIPSLSEVLKDSALLFDLNDKNSLTKAFSQILDPKLRQQLIQAGISQSAKFTWDISAQSLINTFPKVL